MPDLFAAPTNGYHYLKPLEDPFRWVCAVFAQDGAVQAIIRANKAELKTYYPIKFNGKSEPQPLWRNYVFVQFIEGITIDLCRDTPKFIQLISARDDEGIVRPILVRRNAIQENMAMVLQGRFNERLLVRRFYGRGTVVRILDGIMAEKKGILQMDVTPDMRGNTKVSIEVNRVKCLIELHKLAL